MAEAGDDTEKEHEPSQKRLDDARARGDIPQSPDVTTAATYGGFLLACVACGPAAITSIGRACATLLDQADRMGGLLRESASAPLIGLLGTISLAAAPFLAFPAAAALAALLAQRAITIAPEKLAPKWSRISPLAALGRKFGRDGLFDFGKSMAKLVIVSVILGWFILTRMGEILMSHALTPALAMDVLLQLAVAFLCLILLVATLVGGGDFLWQWMSFRRRHRMSRQEVIDEFKQSEGDPHVRAQRRQRGQDIVTNRMLLDVPRADVLIVNPTHYAVALVWNRGSGGAPVCIAKGVDAVAARIRERAIAAGVPIQHDPPTARALFATVDIGQQIRPEQYRAVAAAIRFAEAIRRKAKQHR